MPDSKNDAVCWLVLGLVPPSNQDELEQSGETFEEVI